MVVFPTMSDTDLMCGNVYRKNLYTLSCACNWIPRHVRNLCCIHTLYLNLHWHHEHYIEWGQQHTTVARNVPQFNQSCKSCKVL